MTGLSLRLRRRTARWIPLLLLLLLGACISRQAPQLTHYSLLTLEELGEEPAPASRPELRLGIGPVAIPDVLRRAQIVTRTGDNRFRFDELNRWAGLLEQDIAGVLGENLDDLLGVKQVGIFPWRPHFRPTHQVVVEIQRLDGELGGEAVLRVRWVIVGREGELLYGGGRSALREPVRGDNHGALVRAESRLLARLSREVAAVITELTERDRGSEAGKGADRPGGERKKGRNL